MLPLSLIEYCLCNPLLFHLFLFKKEKNDRLKIKLFSEREFWRAEELHFQSNFNIIQSEAVL